MAGARRTTTRLARLAAIGLCAALAGCTPKPPPAAAPAEKGGPEGVAVRIAVGGPPVQEKFAAESTREGGAAVSAGPKAAPAAKSRHGSPAVVRERVASAVPYPTEAEAEEDAVAQACEVVARRLAELDPPVFYRPPPAEVRESYLRKGSRTARPPDAKERQKLDEAGITGNRVYVEYEVEVTAEQVRELRSQERVGAAVRVLGVLVALALAGFLFFRADEWTRGYLTSWLALAAVTLAGAAAAALIFI